MDTRMRAEDGLLRLASITSATNGRMSLAPTTNPAGPLGSRLGSAYAQRLEAYTLPPPPDGRAGPHPRVRKPDLPSPTGKYGSPVRWTPPAKRPRPAVTERFASGLLLLTLCLALAVIIAALAAAHGLP